MNENLEIFCCYAREDQPHLLKLRTHLKLLEREGILNIWHDMDIAPGAEWEEEINKHLNNAHIILLLISSDFMASDYCYGKEMKRAMERHERKEACVIPILLRPGIWQDAPFAKLQILPKNARPVTDWRSRDQAWSAIAQEIHQAAKEQLKKLPTVLSQRSQYEINNTRHSAQSQDGIARCDWGEAPDVPVFFGRAKELLSLGQWITKDHCRLVALVGIGGVGKTDLSLKLAQDIQGRFDYVIWRRLLDAPTVSEILVDLIKFLSNQQEVHMLDTVSEQISRLLYHLHQHRCLVILDNVETILQSGKHIGQYSPGYEEYGRLFDGIAKYPHQSCLLLTSRVKVTEIARVESKTGIVRSLEIRGLHYLNAKKIFAEIGSFSGSKEDWYQLNSLYNGNPLALKLAAHHIKEVFFGSTSEFLREGKPVFSDLENLLDWHFDRLSDMHKEIMYWFAINREPTSLSQLKEDVLLLTNKEQCASTLQSLQRLIPLEKSARSFTLQPVLIEYMTQRFIEHVMAEIRNGKINLFNSHTLLKTSAPTYVRNIQSRLILKVVSERLLEIYGNREKLEGRLTHILSLLREDFRFTPSYAGGNLLNLLCYSKIDLRGYDFSSLSVWQAYLQGINAQEVNFAYADLSNSVFTDTFGSIASVALSPHESLLAAGTAAGEIRLWQSVRGLPLQVIQGHTDWVCTLAFSPDGKTLASGSDDKVIRLWEVSSGRCLHTLQDHSGSVWSVAFSPDGKTLASGSYDQTIRLWEVSSGRCLNILQGHTNPIRSVAFNPDGKTLASGSYDQTVRLWEISSGRCLNTLQGHTNPIRSVAFNPDGKTLASGSEDQTVRLWEVSSGQCLNTLQGHINVVLSVAFSPDGKILASGSKDRTVRLWDMSSARYFNTLQGHASSVWSVAFSPDGKTLASGSYDQMVRLWEVSSGRCLNTLQGYTNPVRSVAFSPDGKAFASGSDDQMVRLWEVSSGRCLNTLQGHTNTVSSVNFAPDGRVIASGSYDQTVRLWEVSSGQCLNILQGHVDLVRSVAFSPDGKILASGSEDRIVRLWEVSSGRCLNTLQGHNHWVLSVAFSPDGKTLASGSYDRTVRLWEVSSGKCLSILQGHTSTVWSVSFSLDGKILASGSNDQTVRLWEVSSGQCLNTLQGHANPVRSVAFSPDGKTLASGSYDQTVRLWEVNNGRCLNTLQDYGHWVLAVAFSPDGKTLISGRFGGVINVWETQTYLCPDVLRIDRPYDLMNITQVKGLTKVQKDTLGFLGAIEYKNDYGEGGKNAN
ncbi:MAG: TIR domain-containing protein [Ktedonobacteraceae bacterium]|nr:TIR domain-containing protein [Ktedonobacteraceae bacterium]